jgi:hypothetical protein
MPNYSCQVGYYAIVHVLVGWLVGLLLAWLSTASCKKVGLLCTTNHQHSAISSLVANR